MVTGNIESGQRKDPFILVVDRDGTLDSSFHYNGILYPKWNEFLTDPSNPSNPEYEGVILIKLLRQIIVYV